MQGQLRVVIADDHPTFRDGLKRLLETQAECTVVATVGDGQDAVAAIEQFSADLVLLDLSMPRMTGLAALREIRSRSLPTRSIVVTATIEKAEMAAALELGAQGIVLKESASDTLFACVRAVMAGHHWVGRKRVSDVPAAIRDLSAARPHSAPRHFGLTSRELEIVSVVLSGCSNSDIAARFAISEKTVKHHLTNIFDKVGVSNRLELALFALHHGIGMPPPVLAASAVRAEAFQ